MRISFFFDGLNVYHALQSIVTETMWLDLNLFGQAFQKQSEEVVKIRYFSAFPSWDEELAKEHQRYFSYLKGQNVELILGKFRKRNKQYRLCYKNFSVFEEKETDVNIAVSLFEAAIEDEFDKAIIVSGDSDLSSSIEAVKRRFPEKEVGVIIPIGRRANILKKKTDFSMKMKQHHLETCRLKNFGTDNQ